ncbi:coiled-coil domain-containing protein [Dethiosulfovibrio salsuginis]|uniref:Uncharacterized protein n=2 Tax=Dethiosulfovibrio salsuginis TaxID=561720 RepID=A0A1X7K974_9BACT|nr:hypothetical protein [Dethiosulfovibrio salsuginis]SMG36983.1 hypothetical protein SAMN06275492_12243 [Dethiosulfovibrio salsuginis]
MSVVMDRDAVKRRIDGLVRAKRRRLRGSSQWSTEVSLMDAVFTRPSSNYETLGLISGLCLDDTRKSLRRWKLNAPELRHDLVKRIDDYALSVERLICDDEVESSLYEGVRKVVFDRNKPFYTSAMVLRRMAQKTANPFLEDVKGIIPLLDWKNAESFLRTVLDIMGEERGFRPQRVAKANEDPRIAELEVRVSDLTSSLEITQQQLESLEEELKSVREEAAQDASVDFFRELNAPTWGGLLDQLYASEGRIAKLRSEGAIPQELESTATTVRMVVRFLKKSGLKEIVPVGTKLTLSLNDIDGYIYEGSQFGDGEAKDVLVQSPGWSYRGEVVSRPSVKEA